MIEVRQKDIRALIRTEEARPLRDAEEMVRTGARKHYEFEPLFASYGIYGVNGLAVRDEETGDIYADAARTGGCFYFLPW